MIRQLLALLLIFSATPFLAFAQAPQDFLLFYSNDVKGEIEPCG